MKSIGRIYFGTIYLFSAISLLITANNIQAQSVITPGQNVLDKKWIKSGTYEMGCYINSGGTPLEVGTFTVKINSDNNRLSIYTASRVKGSDAVSVDTSIADGNTFKPIYRSSHNSMSDMVINYGQQVSGYYYDKPAKKRIAIKDAGNAFFDSYAYPYLLGLLPLTTGYKNELAVYDFKPENQTNTKTARIEEVKSNMYNSNLTGEHKVWQVNVFEEATKASYVYYIDKDTRRLWKIEMSGQGQQITLIDKETDYNPFTTQFDKEKTLRMVKSGNSVIIGQAFVRDNGNPGPIKNMAVANMHKKQYAQTGVSVILIPYTDFFKEWIKLNEAARKKGKAIPLPKEAAECIKTTTVYDNEGHFEFTSLMPGDYLLYTEFVYVHKGTRTEVTGYTDTYINGIFQGTSANTRSYDVAINTGTTIKKVVTIKSDGDKIDVKLKQI